MNNRTHGIALLIVTILFIILYWSIVFCYNAYGTNSECRWNEDGYYKADFAHWESHKIPCDRNEYYYERKNFKYVVLGLVCSIWLLSNVTGYISSKKLILSKIKK